MTPSTLTPHHPISPIREEDLDAFAHLIPPTGTRLLVLLGKHDGLRLFNVWPGVQIVVPKGPCNNEGGARRWAQIVAIVGQSATLKLADEMGGQCLEVPTLDALRTERRNSAIRAQFDQLTAPAPRGQGMSKAAAVLELGLLHAPITWRQLEIIIDRPALDWSIQNTLF